MSRSVPTVHLVPGAVPEGAWVFKRDVERPRGRVDPGSEVRVVDGRSQFAGRALYNPKSEVVLRILTRHDVPLDDAWFAAAIDRAVTLRTEVLGLFRFTNAARLVNSEGDGLSGLIVDRFADVLSCQVGSLGIQRRFGVIRKALLRHFDARLVHVSASPEVAAKEGFPVPVGGGDAARTVIDEARLHFEVDCEGGHKTGFFLDQRDSRHRVRQLAKGRRVLDLFCYTGGFALNAGRGGAELVEGVDLDEWAIAQAGRNAERNRLDERVRFTHADAFDRLRALSGGEFDLIVVDPAKQANHRGQIDKAIRYYEDLAALAYEKVADGGLVLSCTCSGLVGEREFLGALARGAERAGRRVQFLELGGAPGDHPLASDFPRGRYLTTVLARASRD